MHTALDCTPCFVRQALEAARFATDDPAVHERLVREVLRLTAEMDLAQSPPVVAQKVHRTLRRLIGAADPYRAVKDRFNQMALDMLPQLRATVREAADPLATALRLAIAGNVIDLVDVIDNGSDAPGTVLPDCGKEFRRRFAEADLVIAKGQGNFEALSEEPGRLFFLFRAKCPVIADHAGVPLGTYVLACPTAKREQDPSPVLWRERQETQGVP